MGYFSAHARCQDARSADDRFGGDRWRTVTERLAMGLILITTAASVLGLVGPGSMGMAPLIGALVLLLLGSLRREPHAGGLLLLLLLTLRMTLQGSDRYLAEEITLIDYLLVMIAAAATCRCSRNFWSEFQTLFASVIPVAGAWVWLLHDSPRFGVPLSFGSLSAAQASMLFGLALSLGGARLIAAVCRDPRVRRRRSMLGWGLCSLTSASLILSSGGVGVLLLVGIALAAVLLIPWSRAPGSGWSSRLRMALIVGAVLASGTVVALMPGMEGMVIDADADGGNRLALLRCFVQAPFSSVERSLLGVGFTNSSSWLCQEVRPAAPMIHADNLLAQIGADHGLIALVVLAGLLAWLALRGGRLIRRLADPVVLAGLCAALFTFLDLQLRNGWAQSTLLQVLVGLQIAFLSLPVEDA
jgi:hypothetical protein